MAKKKPELIKTPLSPGQTIKGTPVREGSGEEFYLKLMQEEQAKGPAKIEEVSKWLVGIISTVTGLFGAGNTLFGLKPAGGLQPWTILPFILWIISILAAVFVNFPFVYRYYKHVPASIQSTLSRITWVKWWLLLSSTILFCAGVITFVLLYL